MEPSSASVTQAPETGKEDTGASSSSKAKKPRVHLLSIGSVSNFIGKDYAKHATSTNAHPQTSKPLKLDMRCWGHGAEKSFQILRDICASCLENREFFSNSLEMVVHGTVIIGLINKECIFLAADGLRCVTSKTGNHHTITETNAKKIYPIVDNEIYATTSGCVMTNKKIIGKLVREVEKMTKTCRVSVESCARLCLSLFKKHEEDLLKEEEKFNRLGKTWKKQETKPPSTIIFAGYDSDNPCLLEVDNEKRTIRRYPLFVCGGCGRDKAFLAIAKAGYDKSFSEKKSFRLLKEALVEASDNKTVGGICEIHKLTREKKATRELSLHVSFIKEELDKEQSLLENPRPQNEEEKKKKSEEKRVQDKEKERMKKEKDKRKKEERKMRDAAWRDARNPR